MHASVVNLVRPSQVNHTQHPPLFTTRWSMWRRTATAEISVYVCSAYCLFLNIYGASSELGLHGVIISLWNLLPAALTRNSSGDEIANGNFLRRHFQPLTQRALEAAEFGEITQNKGHYAVQGHSRSFKVTDFGIPIESSCTTSS